MAPSLKKLLFKVQRAASVDDLGPLAQQLERNATMMALVRRQTAPGEAAVQQGLLGAVQRACELVAAAGFAPAPALACGCLKLLIDGFCDVCHSPLASATRQQMRQQVQSGLIDAFVAAFSAVGDALSTQQKQEQAQLPHLPLLASCLLDGSCSIVGLWDDAQKRQAFSTVLLPSIAPVAGLAVATLQHSSQAGSSSSSSSARLDQPIVESALRAATVVTYFVTMVQTNVNCDEAQDAAAAHPAALLLSPQVQLLVACTTALVAQRAYQQQQGRAAALQSPAAAGSSRASSSRGRSCSEAGHGRANSGRANSSSTSQGSAPPKHHELLLSLTGLSGLQQHMGPEPTLPTVGAQLMAVHAVSMLSWLAVSGAPSSSGSSSSAASPEPHNGLVAPPPLLLPLALAASELLLLEPPSLYRLGVGLKASHLLLERWRYLQQQAAAASAAAAGGGCAEQASADDGVAAAAETGAMQQLLQLFQTLTSQQMGAALFSVADEAGWRERVLVPYGYVLSVVCQSADDLEDWTDDDAAAWQQAVTSGSSAVEAAVRALAQLPEGDADAAQKEQSADDLARGRSLCCFVLRRCLPANLLVGSTGAAQAGAAQTQQQIRSMFCSFMKVLNAYLSAASDNRKPAFVLGSVILGVQDVVSRISASSSSDSGGGGEPSPELLMLLGRAFTTAALALRQAMALQPVATDQLRPLGITINQLSLLQTTVRRVPLQQLLPAFVPDDMRQQLLEQQAALEAALDRELDAAYGAGEEAAAATAAAAAAEVSAAETSSSAAQQELPLVSGQLADALQAFSAGLCSAAPVRWCCNNPACRNLTQLSELQLVSGKGSVCSGCKSARFCSAACQKQHWTRQGHKPVCKAIQQQRQQAAADVQRQQK